jgi:hypothetical protein
MGSEVKNECTEPNFVGDPGEQKMTKSQNRLKIYLWKVKFLDGSVTVAKIACHLFLNDTRHFLQPGVKKSSKNNLHTSV